ncbi:MAG: type III pantothenate kinase [Flavobacteriales bacterium]
MNLIIDIGNTHYKAAFFESKDLTSVKSFSKNQKQQLIDFTQENEIHHFIISSVGENASEITRLIQADAMELTHNTPIPIRNNYQTPETLGKDRLANAVGAHLLYPKSNSLIIDMGTCVKYDFINSDGEYKGGAISPGFKMRYKALNHFTERLPLLKDTTTNNFLGNNTYDSISSGVYMGLLNEILGYINLFKQDYPAVNVILTGGEAVFFEKALKNSIFAHPFLTLIGLNAILEHNKKLH